LPVPSPYPNLFSPVRWSQNSSSISSNGSSGPHRKLHLLPFLTQPQDTFRLFPTSPLSGTFIQTRFPSFAANSLVNFPPNCRLTNSTPSHRHRPDPASSSYGRLLNWLLNWLIFSENSGSTRMEE